MNAIAFSAAARAADRAEIAHEQYLTFVLGDALFAIPILSVQELRCWERVSAIPRAPAHVLGVTNLRGAVVPVLDLRGRLGMPSRDPTPTTVVIIVRVRRGAGEFAVGCVVDAVSDVVNVDETAIEPAPELCGAPEQHFVRGVTSIEQRLTMLLDVDGLVEG